MKGIVGGLGFLFLISIWKSMWADIKEGDYALRVPFVLVTISMLGYLFAFVLTLIAIWRWGAG